MKKIFEVCKPFWSRQDLRDKLARGWHWRNANLETKSYKAHKSTTTMIDQIKTREDSNNV